jgi:hypothetical protein
MNQDKIKALAIELYKNEEVAIELANIIFGIRDGDYEPEKFEMPDDFMITGKDREILELIENRSYLLLKLAAYFRGLKEFVEGEENWFVIFKDAEYKTGCTETWFEPEKVYMTEEVAIKVCELLNSGAYSLEG